MTKVSALPGGKFRAEIATSPVRTKRGNSWIELDPTLKRRADGSIAPTAAAGQVELSGGGPAGSVLARIGRDGATTTIRTPFALPAPKLHDDTALYEEVLPDIDLVTSATNLGFTFNWVVKTKKAAADARVRRLSMPIGLEGVKARPERGGFSFETKSGERRFWTPTPTMWDSSGSATADSTGESGESALSAVEDGPDIADRVEAVASTVDGTTMSLKPDLSLLDSPDVVFPVVIDPSVTYARYRNGWGAVWNNFPTKSFWQTAHSLGAGYEGYEQMKVVRSYFRFDTSAFRGAKVLAAELNIRQIHAASCSARPTDAYRTGTLTTSTTWNNQPTRYSLQSSNSSTVGCGSGTGRVGWNVTGGATDLANGNAATGTFMVRARDESDRIAWKQFDDENAQLVVEYVSKPSTPGGITVGTKNSLVPCGTASSPTPIGSDQVTLSSRLLSPDGTAAALRGIFRRYDPAVSPAYIDVAGSMTTSTLVSSLSMKLVDGHTYGFTVKNRVSWSYNGVSGYLDSAFAPTWCYVRVDLSRPAEPRVTSATFKQCLGSDSESADCPSAGQVNVAGTFDLDTDSTDAVAYKWTLNGGEPVLTPTTGGAPRTISVTPTMLGNTLVVQSVDGAGNNSNTASFSFRVRPRVPEVRWSFDDQQALGADTSESALSPLSITSGVAAGKGRQGTALAVTGGASARSDVTGIAGVSASSAFTVGGWIRLGGSTAGPVILLAAQSADGTSFELGYDPSSGRWTAGRRQSAQASLASAAGASPHVWTHIAATYDPTSRRMTLFVNGRPSGTVVYTSATSLNTDWRIGCSDVGPACPEVLYDEVRLYRATLTEGEISQLADPVREGTLSTDYTSVAQWSMNDADDAASASEERFGRGLAIANAPLPRFGVTDDGNHRGMLLPGVAEQSASLSGPAVDTTGSFSIAADVQVADSSKPMVIAQQRGAVRENWSLGYRPTTAGKGRWIFQRTQGDSSTAEVIEVRSPEVLDASEELTSVTATYNRSTGTIALFINGQSFTNGPSPSIDQRQQAPFTSAWGAAGSFLVGNGTLLAASAPFSGVIEQVEIFAGALDAADVYSLYGRTGTVQ